MPPVLLLFDMTAVGKQTVETACLLRSAQDDSIKHVLRRFAVLKCKMYES